MHRSKKKIRDNKSKYFCAAYAVFLQLLCMCGGLCFLDDVFHIPLIKLAMVFWSIVFIILGYSFRHIEKENIKYTVISMIVIVGLLWIFAHDYVIDIFWYALRYSDAADFKHNLIFEIIITGFYTCVAYMLSAVVLKYRTIEKVFAVCWLIGMMYCSVRGYEISVFPVLICIVVLMVGLLGNQSGFIPVCLVVILITVFFGYKDEPYDWGWVKNTYSRFCVLTENLQTNISFNISGNEAAGEFFLMGYSDTSRFGVGISDNNREELIWTGAKPETAAYLPGTVYNVYTDQGWKKNYTDGTYDENAISLIEFLNAIKISNYDKDDIQYFSKLIDCELTYSNIYTNTAFLMNNLLKYNQPDAISYEILNENYRYKNVKNNGFSYKMRYIDVSLQSSRTEKMIYNCISKRDDNIEDKKLWFKELDQISQDDYYVKLTDVIDEQSGIAMYESRKQYIDNNYTEIPDNVTERMYDLVGSLTENCSNDYEKVKCIENYLQSLTYSKNPKIDKDTESLLDDFLFNAKEGYCVDFASAMAVMVRMAGVPSRYVEGFCVDFSNRVASNEYSIVGSDAHAWAEVYIDGYGWLRLEATPGYQNMAYKEWNIKTEADNTARFNPENYTPPYEINEIKTAGDQSSLNTSGKKNDIFKKVITWFSIIVLSLLIIVGMFTFLFIVFKKIWYNHLNLTDKYWYEITLLERKLEKKYRKREEGESLREFVENIEKDANAVGEDIEDIYQIVDTYEKIRFGYAKVTQEDLDELRRENK